MKILLIVHTEYHLLYGLKVICALHDLNNDEIIIQQISPEGARKRRLNKPLNFIDTNIEFRKLYYHNKRFKDKDLRNKITHIADERPDILYVFNEHQKIFPYLFSLLKKYGTKILLCPDGVNVYSNFNPLKWRITEYIFGNFYLWSNHIPSYLPLPGKHYAYRKGVQAVVVDSKLTYRNYTNREVIELRCETYTKQQFLALANHIFNFHYDECAVEPGSILWIDQPHDEIIVPKRELLYKLKEKYLSKKIYIKPHPFSNVEEMNFYEKMDGFEVIHISAPVELLIENLVDVSILSAHSTAMYYHNPSCRYFWTSALFKELPKRMCNPRRFTSFKYIKVVNDFDEIKL